MTGIVEHPLAPRDCEAGVRTDADGRLTRRLRIPGDRERVDLIVNEAGHIGPYTHESLRAEWGPTATSSRQSLVLDRLADPATLDVLLEVR